MFKASSRLRIFTFAFLLSAFLAVSANAQFRGGIQGSVLDAAGAVVPNVTVTLLNKETNQSQTTVTSDDGFYRFTGLPPGLFTLTVEGQGFKKTVIGEVKVDAEAVTGQDVLLEAGQIAETVTVEAESDV